MDFLNVLSDYLNVNIYYEKILKYEDSDLKNLYNFINIKWTLTIKNIKENKYSTKTLNKYNSDFNNNLKKFIDKDIVIALFVKNIIDRY